MKIIASITIAMCLTASSSILAEQTSTQYPIHEARAGCLKPIGYLPTPSKLMCMLTAFGKAQSDVKPKALAIVYSVCKGRPLQPQPANYTPKIHPTLGACLKDPSTVNLINKELTASGFREIHIVNSSVLVPATNNSVSPNIQPQNMTPNSRNI